MASHTPTPWIQSDEVEDHGTHWEHRIIGQGGGTVARVTSKGVHGPERKAEMYCNAAYVVNACNAHDALVMALKGLLCHHRVAVNPSDTLQDRIDAARAALKLAEAAG